MRAPLTATALVLLLLAGCGTNKKATPARPAPATPSSVSTTPPPPAAPASKPPAAPASAPAAPAAVAPPTEAEIATIRRRLLEATSMYRVYHKAWPTSAPQTLDGLPYAVMSPNQLAVFERIVHQPLPDGSLALFLTWRRSGLPVAERYILQDRVD